MQTLLRLVKFAIHIYHSPFLAHVPLFFRIRAIDKLVKANLANVWISEILFWQNQQTSESANVLKDHFQLCQQLSGSANDKSANVCISKCLGTISKRQGWPKSANVWISKCLRPVSKCRISKCLSAKVRSANVKSAHVPTPRKPYLAIIIEGCNMRYKERWYY